MTTLFSSGSWVSRAGQLLVTCAGLAISGRLAAELVPEPATVDLGRQKQQVTASAVVKLTNAGKTPVEILRVSADCSCTAATPKETKLEPGQSTSLEVSFETRSYQGEIHRRVLVQTSEGDVTVPLKAVVSEYDNWVLGSHMVVFGPSRKGERAEASITLQYTGSEKAQVKELRPTEPWLTAEVAESREGSTRIKIVKEANAPAGNLQPRIRVLTTDTKEAELSISVFASVTSNVAVSPSPILMPRTKVGQKVTFPVRITGWDSTADPRGELPEAEAKLRARDGRDALMDIFVVPERAGTWTKLLRIFAGDQLELEVPVIIQAEP